ncbi:hypothetical protein J4207_00190 [Candidatus Woesearchaeota archaeon]|nr:hypothetical protein [Candidatus Woesearchaeota archaeon]
MKGFAIAEKGFEDVSVLEVKELIGAKGKAQQTIVAFTAQEKDLCLLCYKSQSLRRVGKLLALFTFENLSDIEKEAQKIGFDMTKTFAVECERNGEHAFKSVDVEDKVSAIIKQKTKAEHTYKNPDWFVYVQIEQNTCMIGIDFCGFDLSQRDYKIFAHPASLKGTIAYGILRFVGYTAEKFLLNTWSKSGVIEIEAAFFASGKAVNYYRKDSLAFWKMPEFIGEDKSTFFDDTLKEKKLKIHGIHTDLRHVTAGKKNAKIAGVEKMITFSRIANDWLDVKFREGEVDILVGYAVGSETEQFKEFFHQAEYMAKEAVVITLNRTVEDEAKQKGLVLKEKRVIERGQSKLVVQVYCKK